jgi:hypothetical protein
MFLKSAIVVLLASNAVMASPKPEPSIAPAVEPEADQTADTQAVPEPQPSPAKSRFRFGMPTFGRKKKTSENGTVHGLEDPVHIHPTQGDFEPKHPLATCGGILNLMNLAEPLEMQNMSTRLVYTVPSNGPLGQSIFTEMNAVAEHFENTPIDSEIKGKNKVRTYLYFIVLLLFERNVTCDILKRHCLGLDARSVLKFSLSTSNSPNQSHSQSRLLSPLTRTCSDSMVLFRIPWYISFNISYEYFV